MSDSLEVGLDLGLPRELAVGAGTTLFVYGSCWHPDGVLESLEIEVGGRRGAVEEFAMPRRDVYTEAERDRARSFDPDADWMQPHDGGNASVREPRAQSPSYRSGFWAFADLPGVVRPEKVEIGLRGTLADGRVTRGDLGEIKLLPEINSTPAPVGAAPDPSGGPLVAICMATFNPDLAQFEAQVRSIQAQTHQRWVCVVSDDDSREELRAEMASLLAGDPRFVFRPSHRRLGFFRNFERALSLVQPEADLVTLSDQDDRWYPHKLARLIDAMDGHQLAFSDMRITDEDGRRLSDTFFDHRPNNTTELDRLLLMNTVTGAASMLRRELLDLILPLPMRIGPRAFHDQWIAAVAMATGSVGFVPEPLYDYVQHGRSVLGHPASYDEDGEPRRERIRRLAYGQRELYFGDYCRLQVVARTLLLRCESRMAAGKAAQVKRLLRLRSAAGLARLGARSLRPRTRSASFGEERKLLRALAWPAAVRAMSRTDRGRRSFDASLPEALRDEFEVQVEEPPGIEELRRKTEPFALDVRAGEPSRINLLIPGVDLRGFFGGYIGIFNLARKLAGRHPAVRLVCFERDFEHLPPDWRRQVERFSGLAGLFDAVEITDAPAAGDKLAVSGDDRFVATTWWSAHIATATARELGRERFLYLVQDYEPLFYPMGTWHTLAEQTYSFPHHALFSTEFLREFFRTRGLGVFAEGEAAGAERSTFFRNAITPVEPPSAATMAARERRRLLFYARLETYSPRNLFDLGVLALSDLIADGTIDERWDLYGIGSVGGPARFDLGGRRELTVLPRQDEGSYAEFLRKHDLGLSLMLSPHPSLVPIEMASAGMVTVTNSYANKTSEALTSISPNLHAGEPTREGLREALREAFAAVDDVDARVAGARVEWPTDWDAALDAEVLDKLAGFLDAD
jgi:WsaF, C-terminal domain/WsaF, N-terminal domain/Glycosyl transferase family 2